MRRRGQRAFPRLLLPGRAGLRRVRLCRPSEHRVDALLLLFALPVANLIPGHPVERAVLVAKPEPAGRKPPLDETADRCTAAPTIGIAAAFVVVRVMDATQQRPIRHGNSLARPPRSLGSRRRRASSSTSANAPLGRLRCPLGDAWTIGDRFPLDALASATGSRQPREPTSRPQSARDVLSSAPAR